MSPEFRKHILRERRVELDQRDRVAARPVAAEMEVGDVDAVVAEQRAERPMKPGLSRLVT